MAASFTGNYECNNGFKIGANVCKGRCQRSGRLGRWRLKSVVCSGGGCICFKQRPSRDPVAEPVFYDEEDQDTGQDVQLLRVPTSSASDAAVSCVLLKTPRSSECHNELCVHSLDLHIVPRTPIANPHQYHSTSVSIDSSMSIVMTLSKSPKRTWYLQNLSTTLHRLHSVNYKPLTRRTSKLPLDLHYSNQAQLLLSTVANWNFNVFTLDILTHGRPLFNMSLHLFRQHNLLAVFHLDVVKLMHTFGLIEDGYHRSNPYHNSVHATDVTQAMNCFLLESKLSAALSPLERMASLLAAASHDIDHPGINQSFLIATGNPLVELYESISVLENHHWRSLMCILHSSHVFDHMDSQAWTKLKWQIRSQILATDITRQEDILHKFQKHLNEGTLDLTRSETDRNFALQIALKCADICNPCRPWELAHRWGQLVCQEFFLQGDDERRMRLPVSKTFDRYACSVSTVQSGFIMYVVHPLFIEWQRFLCSPLSNELLRHAEANLRNWTTGAAAPSVRINDSSNDSTPSTNESDQHFSKSSDDVNLVVSPGIEDTSETLGNVVDECKSSINEKSGNSRFMLSSSANRLKAMLLGVPHSDVLRRSSLQLPPLHPKGPDSPLHRRSSLPVVDYGPLSTARRCILLTSLEENPHVPSLPGEPDIAQLSVEDRDTTCLLLMQCNGRRGSAPAACIIPSLRKTSSSQDRRSKSHSAACPASLRVETSSSACWPSNVVFPSDQRRVVYMVAEIPSVSEAREGGGSRSRNRRSNSAQSVIFRPRFVAGRRCSSPAIGVKNKSQWLMDESGLPSFSGHSKAFALDSDLPIICRT